MAAHEALNALKQDDNVEETIRDIVRRHNGSDELENMAATLANAAKEAMVEVNELKMKLFKTEREKAFAIQDVETVKRQMRQEATDMARNAARNAARKVARETKLAADLEKMRRSSESLTEAVERVAEAAEKAWQQVRDEATQATEAVAGAGTSSKREE